MHLHRQRRVKRLLQSSTSPAAAAAAGSTCGVLPPRSPAVVGTLGESYFESRPGCIAWGRGLDHLDQITWPLPLRGTRETDACDIRRREDKECLAGSRNAQWAVARIPGWFVIGAKLRKLGDDFLDLQPTVVTQVMKSIMGPVDDRRSGIDTQLVEAFRAKLSAAFGRCSTARVQYPP